MSQFAWIETTDDETWLPGLRAAVLLLRAGEPVYFHPEADTGEPYLAIMGTSAPVREWLKQRGVVLVEDLGQPRVEDLDTLRPPAVAVFGGAGSPYNHASVVATLGFPWFYVTGPDVVAGALRHADVFVVPGGGWRHGNGQLADLDDAGTREVVRFIEAGGGYLASCAGSLIAMRLPAEALAAHHPTKAAFTLLDIENWEPLRNAEGGHRSPGIGRVQTRIASPRHPVAIGLGEGLEMTHYNGPIFAEPDSALSVIARYAGVTPGFTPKRMFLREPGSSGRHPIGGIADGRGWAARATSHRGGRSRARAGRPRGTAPRVWARCRARCLGPSSPTDCERGSLAVAIWERCDAIPALHGRGDAG